jgi:hypothetical protein
MKHSTSFLDLFTQILFVALYILSGASFGHSSALPQQDSSGPIAKQETKVVEVQVFENEIRMNGRTYPDPERLIVDLPAAGGGISLVVTGGDETVRDRRVGRVAGALYRLAETRPGLEVGRR